MTVPLLLRTFTNLECPSVLHIPTSVNSLFPVAYKAGERMLHGMLKKKKAHCVLSGYEMLIYASHSFLLLHLHRPQWKDPFSRVPVVYHGNLIQKHMVNFTVINQSTYVFQRITSLLANLQFLKPLLSQGVLLSLTRKDPVSTN